MKLNDFINPQIGIRETISGTDFKKILKVFLPIAKKIIKLEKLPTIILKKTLSHGEQPSMGRFYNDSYTLELAIANRQPVDALRTLAHELVHAKQDSEHVEIDPSTGSDEENEANVIAGIVMREFNKLHPEFLTSQPIKEGGWDTTATQGTVIGPAVTKQGLAAMNKFITGFNQFLKQQGIGAVRVGVPTGSSAYHNVDSEDTIYGDIDLQIVVPELEELADKTASAVQSYWYKLEDTYVKNNNTGIHPDSSAGHPILPIGNGKFVQVDMMIHPEPLEKWGAARTVPERGVKGLLHGNMFSVLGELLTMSIQHSGVQFKVRDNVKQPYSTTRSNYKLETISIDPETFVLDIFKHECIIMNVRNPKVSPILQQHPGKNLEDVKVANLVYAVRGLAESFEMNNMFGQGDLANYSDANDFLNKFWQVYEGKAMKDVNAAKRDKAETPEAKARAEQDKQKILSGLQMIKREFER